VKAISFGFCLKQSCSECVTTQARPLQRKTIMFRKTIIALLAIGVVGLVSPTIASARGGGFGGFRGGGWRGGGWGGYGLGLGIGLAAPYAYGGYGYPYAGYGYPVGFPYSPSYYFNDDGGGCYLVRQRVMTRYGWRVRRVQVCG
jgi:hypothetical protein